MNPKVDAFLSKTNKWQAELEQLRLLLLDCGLTEDFKWNHPCYTFQNRNIALIHGFKEYCALLFVNGALLADIHGILIQQTENTQAARQIRFVKMQEIIKQKSTLKAYIYEAIEAEKAGLKVDFKTNSKLEFCEEFQAILDKNPDLQTAFEALTPGRKKAYNMYFSGAKQPKTRYARIDKYSQRILDGKGLNDCVCGLSHKMPSCDGSHKYLRK
ncbi:DUF1801 domain-containing protein [Persicitalea jodogahamensis]|uniref:YdhG-like domain-containing protein n=1 Tax=Persicitalea jodogahamensis TaxID=402147 RepID=A0A8J3D5Z2_9BACT|nr:DUF1801 domain-containing protein [Persicitalea jodogahamensis]GHB64657.1 hypothetical protein GCM10007390_18270 [Persicitalea jodogahamensis]